MSVIEKMKDLSAVPETTLAGAQYATDMADAVARIGTKLFTAIKTDDELAMEMGKIMSSSTTLAHSITSALAALNNFLPEDEKEKLPALPRELVK